MARLTTQQKLDGQKELLSKLVKQKDELLKSGSIAPDNIAALQDIYAKIATVEANIRALEGARQAEKKSKASKN